MCIIARLSKALVQGERRHDLDELDFEILDLLRENGRQTNQEVAARLGVSEATVRKRLRELAAAGVMRVVAVTDPHHLGLEIDVNMAIQVELQRLQEVVDELTAMAEISYLGITSGASSIVAAGLFHSNGELLEFLTSKVGSIPGIRKIETTHVLKVVKRRYDWIMPR
jgi:Lrp/AsnC family transcriptional regulator for asnA, asnC and gidA